MGQGGGVDGERCFGHLDLWLDPEEREGPQAMAVDEWLLGWVERPLLRVYRWRGSWASIGCFVAADEARRRFPSESGVRWVRRWTGGGIVDHRADWTYSLIVPADRVAGLGRPRESYRRIHEALGRALLAEGRTAGGLAAGGPGADGHGWCFANPVAHDLLGPDGEKWAGAAQRRTRLGLLHQGSVCVPVSAQPGHEADRADCFARCLARETCVVEIAPDASAIQALVERRYGAPEWLHGR